MACAFSPSGDLFVTGSSCGDLTVWDDKMKCLHSEKAHDLGITCCDFSSQPVSDGEQSLQFFRLATCGQDCQIRIWGAPLSHILGVYSASSSLKSFVILIKSLFGFIFFTSGTLDT